MRTFLHHEFVIVEYVAAAVGVLSAPEPAKEGVHRRVVVELPLGIVRIARVKVREIVHLESEEEVLLANAKGEVAHKLLLVFRPHEEEGLVCELALGGGEVASERVPVDGAVWAECVEGPVCSGGVGGEVELSGGDLR
eukprot:2436053-Pleurochrysis_carterae.AAC.1